MNIIRMTGGLGNQMFAYALFLKFKSMGIDCRIDDYSEYEGHDNRRPLFLNTAFGIDYPVATRAEYDEFTDSSTRPDRRILRKLRGRKTREYRERGADFDPEVLKKDNAYLTGYFQSEKYFADIKNDVLKCFSFNEATRKKAGEILESNGIRLDAMGDHAFVSVHIRRGDYLNVSEVYGNICTDEYYRLAIGIIREKTAKEPFFLVFSNDIEWTRKWCEGIFDKNVGLGHSAQSNTDPGSCYRVMTGTGEDEGYVDMYIMSRCAHNIIANSSFSWWGAYLNTNPQKNVVAPSKWVNTFDQRDIYTDDMILI